MDKSSLVLPIGFILAVLWVIMFFKLNDAQNEVPEQCERLGGAYIRDNHDDFHCIATIKMERPKGECVRP